MRKFICKKIILYTLGVFFVFSSLFLTFPKESMAQIATTDVGNTAQNTITAGASGASAASTYSLQIKEYFLDGIVTNILKQVVHQITGSIVNWINSGFEGSPAFLQNPGSFFLDVADQITGDFLAKGNGGPLSELCSPFSIDIRLALAFKYRPRVQQRYTCTIGKIIENSKNAIAGASINGFTAGDFRQGGWPAFVSLTTEPQNNPFGAYLVAESELSLRVANAQIGKKEEISAGRGFLSWRDPKCTAENKKKKAANEAKVSSKIDQNPSAGAEWSDHTEGGYNGAITDYQMNIADCPIQTPGSVIAGTLDKQLGVPADKLNLADEINEIVDALFAQLVTQVLQAGLGGVSGKGAGDSSSYISQIQAEANAVGPEQTKQVQEMKKTLLQNMDTYIKNTTEYKTNKDASLNTITATKNSYEKVKSCYTTKISSNSGLSTSQIQFAQGKIAVIDGKITAEIAPIAAPLLLGAQQADFKQREITSLKTSITTATTINDLNTPGQKLSILIQNQSIITAIDVLASKNEYETLLGKTQPMNADANNLQRECDLFPIVYGG